MLYEPLVTFSILQVPFNKLINFQVQLKEYVKVSDTICEVDPKEENGFKFSRRLNFKVSSMLTILNQCFLSYYYCY